MHGNHRLFGLSAGVAIGALLCCAGLPAVTTAQTAPPPATSPAAPPDQSQGDPPARVGRIASQMGAVSFRTAADTQWSAASPNYPVSAGDSFWTEPTAQAELEISASHVAMAGETEFDIASLDASGLQSVAPRGETYFHLENLAPNEVWSVQTPRGLVRLTSAGRYDIVVGTTDQPTLVTVLEGAAEIEGPGVSLRIGANQTATVTGDGPYRGSIGAEVRDAFLTAWLNAERPPRMPIPAQIADLPGGSDLYTYGQWAETPDYGPIWYPPVAADWVPYREGYWGYVVPWGWTWVDSAPWGFAPFHYGRWAHIHGRWGWIAGGVAAPVYAPALVAFLGLAVGDSIGWVPLGPGEVYHPWYPVSAGYVRQINMAHVRDMAALGAPVMADRFINRGAATAVNVGAMMASRPIQAAARPISAEGFASAHAVIGLQPERPTAATFGVTPAIAHQFNLPPGGFGRGPAPGPAVRTGALGIRPPLIGMPRLGEPVGPGARRVLPPLPPPGTRPAGLPESRESPREEGRPPPFEHPFPEPAEHEARQPPMPRVVEPDLLRGEPPRAEPPRAVQVRPPPRVEAPRPPPRPAPEQERRPGER